LAAGRLLLSGRFAIMDAEEIFDQLDNTRERLLATIEPLPDESLVVPGAMDDWSVMDLLAHLTAWESELVTALLQIDRGKKPARLLEAYSDVDGYNARNLVANRGRQPDRIFDDLLGVRRQLEQWLGEFDDRDLNDTKRYTWTNGRALWEIIEENSFGHESKHQPELEAFAAGWLATHKDDHNSGANSLETPDQPAPGK
jgi:hypothetical protein